MDWYVSVCVCVCVCVCVLILQSLFHAILNCSSHHLNPRLACTIVSLSYAPSLSLCTHLSPVCARISQESERCTYSVFVSVRVLVFVPAANSPAESHKYSLGESHIDNKFIPLETLGRGRQNRRM
ncbi:hypothetical protein E2C01_099929 [Portunus trituberculatus]|uniref:Uncharacterized protein n=1 Tax=Portunus trituberculatus TaxID=210409 RepID=A0A5B7K528_PORTR|nr:hypothetical protein [Portunus trituberculatus]